MLLNEQEEAVFKRLIEEVLTTCRWDDTGVTGDLIEPALEAAEVLGMTREEIEELSRP